MKKLLPLLFLLTGCASFNYRIIGWYNIEAPDPSATVLLSNGKRATIIGNPRISCYDKNNEIIADGLFVRIENEYLLVDQFGFDYVWVLGDNSGNYCTLWEQK